MASVTVNLTGFTDSGVSVFWPDNTSLGSLFSAAGSTQTLNTFSLFYSGSNVGLVSLSLTAFNDRFTTAFEATGRIIVEASDGEMLEVQIANADMTEAYDWIPTNSAEVIAFATHVIGLSDQTATLTLTDDPPSTAHAVDAGDVAWTFAIPAATVTHTAAPTLFLADFDDSGLVVECAALLEASDDATAGNFFYEDTDRGGTDEPLDGELGLGNDDTVISGIRRRTSTLLQLNDDNNPVALDIGAYFSTGGAGNDLTIYLQTMNGGEVSFTVASTVSFSRVDQVRFTLPSDAQTLLDNISTGDRFIFALARPTPVAVDHAVNAGDVAWTFALPQASITHTPRVPDAHTINAGDIAWAFAIPQAAVTLTARTPDAHTVDAGNVAWAFDIPQASVTHTTVQPQAYTRNAGDVAWAFALPQPTVTHTTPTATAPARPAAPTLTVDSDTQITAVGVAPDDGGDTITSYDWRHRTTTPLGAWISRNDQTNLTQIFSGLDAAEGYRFQFRATNSVGNSSYSPSANATTDAAPSTAHVVDAGDVSWAFALPQPTVTHTTLAPTDHTVDAGDVAWAFAVPQPTITHTRGIRNYSRNAGDVAWRFRIPQPRVTYRGILPSLPSLGVPVPVTDRIIALNARIALLISQWTGNAQINALLRGMYGLIDTEFVQALKDLERMRNWDTAEGVWLDYIGRRLGFTRPTIDVNVTRFGFEGSSGVGFNQAPFATTGFVPQVPIPDAVYLLCLKVWAGTILTSGSIPDMNTAVRRSFPAAYYTDGADSTIALVTGASGMQQTTARDILTAADAWPRPAGVGLTVT